MKQIKLNHPGKSIFAKRGSKKQINARKMFKTHGSNNMRGMKGSSMKNSSISPSVNEFDDMMSKASTSFSSNKGMKKKSLFSKKM